MDKQIPWMLRCQQLIFVVSLLALSWLAMLAVHEFGHVVGAFASGGSVQSVVLDPLTISRTDVLPNPHPSLVVWLGPALGCLIPVVTWLMMPRHLVAARQLAMFFAGFCLIANGAYIAFGSFDRIGDCGVMLQNGSPLWLLLVFGALTISLGLYAWHCLGSAKHFLSDPTRVNPTMAYTLAIAVVLVLVVELMFSPM